ncbi:hypothetical protein MO973_11690 [Paenibacillus sp. TRM 82003]|nr:hypothetical protein [Paenibacillus sp. TRM 82003]
MFAAMRREAFDAMDVRSLGEACFSPIVPRIRAKPLETKEQVYRSLTRGQQALFMFHVYYGHAKNSLEEFAWWSAHYMGMPEGWPGIKEALAYFDCEDMLEIAEATELEFVRSRGADAVPDPEAARRNADRFALLYERLGRAMPDTLRRVGEHIRREPFDFVRFTDDGAK